MSVKSLSKKSKLSIAAGVTLAGVSAQVGAVPGICQTVNVTSSLDDFESVPTGSLREAVNTINSYGSCGDFHTITFSGAVTQIELDERIYLSQDIYFQGPGADNLTIQPEASPSGIYTPQFNSGSSDIKMSGIKLSGFQTSAVRSYGGDVILDNMSIMDGTSSNNGAAVNVNGSGGTLTISNSTISGNTSTSQAGAVYVRNMNLDISDSTLSDNEAEGSGGAVNFAYGGYTGLSVSISDVSIDSNHSLSGSGGGLYVRGNNLASMDISSTSITNNSLDSGSGGGVYLRDNDSSATMTIENSTISNNAASALGSGGGLSVNMNSASLDITSSTIVENSANYGGGIRDGYATTINLDSTILANNSATSDGANAYGTIANADYSLVGDTTGMTISAHSNSTVNVDGSSLDLRALADNGGLGLTHLPCDDDIVEQGASSSSLSEDQVGNTRLVGGNVDIGARELQSVDSCDLSEEEIEEIIEENEEEINQKKSDDFFGTLGAGFIAMFSGLALFRRRSS